MTDRFEKTLESKKLLFILSLCIFGIAIANVRADSLVVNTLSYADVRINAVKDGEVYFTTSTGNQVHNPWASVTKMTLADEPAFNSAEEAYAARDFDKATIGYDKTLR